MHAGGSLIDRFLDNALVPALTPLAATAASPDPQDRLRRLGADLGVPPLRPTADERGASTEVAMHPRFAALDELVQSFQSTSLAVMHQLNPCALADHPVTGSSPFRDEPGDG